MEKYFVRLSEAERESLEKICLIACSEPPEGRSRWTIQMIADELIRLEVRTFLKFVNGSVVPGVHYPEARGFVNV